MKIYVRASNDDYVDFGPGSFDKSSRLVDNDILDYGTKLQTRLSSGKFLNRIIDDLKFPLVDVYFSGPKTEVKSYNVRKDFFIVSSDINYNRIDGAHQIKQFEAEQAISGLQGILKVGITSYLESDFDQYYGDVSIELYIISSLNESDKQKLLSTSIDSVLRSVHNIVVDNMNKNFSVFPSRNKFSKLKRSEMDFDEWYNGNMYEDDSLEFIQLVESKVEKKYLGCEVFEEPSTQGTMSLDFWSVTLEDGRHYSVEFNFNEELGEMFELGPKRASTQYVNEIISQIKSSEVLVEEY